MLWMLACDGYGSRFGGGRGQSRAAMKPAAWGTRGVRS